MPPPETGTGREQMVRRRRDVPWYYDLPGARFHFLHEVAEGFVFGAVAGSAFYFLRGLRSSPSGGGRLACAASAVRSNAPCFAGSVGAFFGLRCGFEKAVSLARGEKEDHWNWIAAMATSSALCDVRQGARVAARSALVWGAFAALAEGAMIALDNHPVLVPPAPAAEGRRPALPDLDYATAAGHLHGDPGVLLGIPATHCD